MLKPRTLLAAAVVLVIALTPSVTDAVVIHQDHQEHAWLFWAWIGLAVVVALLAGEELLGVGGG